MNSQLNNKEVLVVIFAVLVPAYFWKGTIICVEESSDKNFKFMGFVTVVGAIGSG